MLEHKISLDVRVTFNDGDTFTDGILATTEHEALMVAWWNWEFAKNIEGIC